MERYDYRETVMDDVKNFIREKIEWNEYTADDLADDDLVEQINVDWYDEAFVDDSVTGNASGSYTFSTWKAEENLCHNFDLISDVAEYFGDTIGDTFRSAESLDVSIRCMILGEVWCDALAEVIAEMR